MSLVNNMLRDLDQRRRDTHGSSHAIALTPASEIIIAPKKNLVAYIVAGLVLALAALAYLWWNLNGDAGTTQLQLNSPLAISSEASGSGFEPSAQAAGGSIVDSSQSNPTESTSANASASAPTTQLVAQNPIASLGSDESPPTAASSNSLTEESAKDVVASTVQVAVQESTVQESSSTTQVIRDEDLAVAATQVERESARPSIVDPVVQDSIKSDAELSPEQRDTASVQRAIALLADSQTAEAYILLEEFIAENRNGHQSRETYAKLLLRDGDLQSAYALVEEGLEYAPNHAGFKKMKARLLIANDQVGEAVNLLISRAPEVSQDMEYHDILAGAQLASRDFEGASISYRGLVQQDQTQGKWWYGYAASHDLLGNSNAARQAYAQAMQISNLSAGLRRRSQERLNQLSQ